MNKITNLVENARLEDWIDGQEVMQKLKISPRTLQTLRSNGTIPFTRIGHKLYNTARILRPFTAQNLAAGESLQGERVLGYHVQEQDSSCGSSSVH